MLFSEDILIMLASVFFFGSHGLYVSLYIFDVLELINTNLASYLYRGSTRESALSGLVNAFESNMLSAFVENKWVIVV